MVKNFRKINNGKSRKKIDQTELDKKVEGVPLQIVAYLQAHAQRKKFTFHFHIHYTSE